MSDRKSARAKKLEQGWRDMSIWLPPHAVAALDDLQERMPEASRNDLIVRAVIHLADNPDATIRAESENSGTFTSLDNLSVDLLHQRSLIDDLTTRVHELEKVVHYVPSAAGLEE